MIIKQDGGSQRARFIIKRWFQFRFILWPLVFLLLFLAGAGVYLYAGMSHALVEYLMYPSGPIGTMWAVGSPLLLRATMAGGGFFLLTLGIWVWIKFRRVATDIGALEEWSAPMASGGEPGELPHLSDVEMRITGIKLAHAVEAHGRWRKHVAQEAARVGNIVTGLAGLEGEELFRGLDGLAAGVAKLRERVDEVAIREDLG